MTVIKSYVVRIEEATPGSVTVVTDGVTIQGDGTVGSPVSVIPGVFDDEGDAAAALAAAIAYTDAAIASIPGSSSTINSDLNMTGL